MSSGDAILTVSSAAIAPAITTQPVSQTVTAGTPVTFTAGASGSPAPTYQWWLNGANVSGATSASYTIASAAAASAGTYTVVATNTAGSATSTGAVLSVTAVNQAPTISPIADQSTVMNVGVGPLAFTVGDVETAAGNLTVSAASSNQTLVPNVHLALSGSGASRTVAVMPLGGQTGTTTISVTVSDGLLTATGTFVLTVNPAPAAPVITTQPVSQAVTAGASVTFSAAASGTPAPTYQWRLNGVNISGATAASYTIAGVTSASAGTYAVVTSNSAGSATSNGAVLTVNVATAAPVITTQPVSQTVTAGASVTFSAAASGTPAPTYQWRKNGVNIGGATGAAYAIANVLSGDAGTYSVVATNSAGTATSSGAVLTVNPVLVAPAITTQPVSQTVTAGTSVTFTAAASGTPAPTYQWRKDGVSLSGATAASYTLASVAAANAGAYTVVATNSAGSATSTGAVLTIRIVASPLIVSADFNGDGQTDILWQNSVTGECVVWLMAGANIGSSVSLGIAPAGWQISGTGDFNKDGRTDILWRNGATGENRVWLMSGTTVTSIVSLNYMSTSWTVGGTGDFNGDGQSDILWRNNATGSNRVWLMSGTTVSKSVYLSSLSSAWQMCATGDFNRDGSSDILWQNSVTGESRVWLMSGTKYSSSVTLGTVAPEWQIVGTGDFNGDGQSDILWQNVLTGERTFWSMNGTSAGGSTSFGLVPPDWIIRN